MSKVQIGQVKTLHNNEGCPAGSWVFLLLLFFLVYTVEAHIRANTQNVQQGKQETRGVGEGMEKTMREQRHEEICGRERDG